MREDRLEALSARWADCHRCPLSQMRKQVVMYRGNPRARLMLIGEAPGVDEDEQGFPFVGSAGKTLDRLLVKSNLNPETDVCIVNMLGCRPPANRKPYQQELRACRPRLESLIRLVRPQALLLLGATAAKLAGVPSIMRWRGKRMVVEFSFGELLAVGTFHPSYLNRTGGSVEIRKDMLEDIAHARTLAEESQRPHCRIGGARRRLPSERERSRPEEGA